MVVSAVEQENHTTLFALLGACLPKPLKAMLVCKKNAKKDIDALVRHV